MAQTAKKESEEVAAIVKPDFERAISVMKSTIKPAEEDNAESRGNLSAAWKVIEDDCHVNKGAAKVFRQKILEASVDKKDDFLRSLRGLMLAAGLGISRDLVDIAEGANPISDVIPVDQPEQAKRDAEFDAAAPDKNEDFPGAAALKAGQDAKAAGAKKPAAAKPVAKRAPPKLVAVGGAAAPLSNDFEEHLG